MNLIAFHDGVLLATKLSNSLAADNYQQSIGFCYDASRPSFNEFPMRKDISLALEMAHTVGSKNVLGDLGLQTFDGASEDEHCKDLDSRVVFRYLGGNENWHIETKN